MSTLFPCTGKRLCPPYLPSTWKPRPGLTQQQHLPPHPEEQGQSGQWTPRTTSQLIIPRTTYTFVNNQTEVLSYQKD
jgi:hypothetical protein